MLRKLSFKMTTSIVLVMLLITTIIISFYTLTQKETYISLEIKTMSEFCDGFQNISFESDYNEFDDYLDIYDNRNYTVIIADSDMNKIYSTKAKRSDNFLFSERIINQRYSFSEDAAPEYNCDHEKNIDEIVLRKIVENNGNSYYIYIKQNLKSANSVLEYTNTNLLFIVITYTVLSAFAMCIVFSRITKSIKKLSSVTESITKKNYSARFNGKITKDELGILSENINEMADTIQNNINSLNNYNFLLKEDLNYMAEYDKIRQSVVSNITHELKTPLAIISSQIEMMNCTTDAEKSKYYYDSAMEEIDKMSRLISGLLNYSVTKHSIFEGEIRNVDLSKSVTNLCNKIRELVVSRKITFNTYIDEGCSLHIEENHIEHVFNNYLFNAIRHSENDGTIEVRLKKNREKIRLSVFNRGKNIEEKNKEKIWSDFFSSEKIQDKNEDIHAGLGLFIVKEISILDRTDCGFINQSDGVEFWFDFADKNSTADLLE